jgi:SAM-dependent methyltransferase
MTPGAREAIDWTRVAGEAAPLVRPETRSKYFPQNPLRQAIIRRFLAAVGDELEAAPWTELLDLGCGEGFVDYYLGRRFPGRPITGIDPDPGALEAARLINPGNRYLHADGRALPFPARRFDAVICIEVLEHLSDYPAVLAEILRVSRGLCLISVPAWPWYQGTNFLLGKNLARFGEHPDHVVSFTRASLARALRASLGGTITVRIAYPWLIARRQD